MCFHLKSKGDDNVSGIMASNMQNTVRDIHLYKKMKIHCIKNNEQTNKNKHTNNGNTMLLESKKLKQNKTKNKNKNKTKKKNKIRLKPVLKKWQSPCVTWFP